MKKQTLIDSERSGRIVSGGTIGGKFFFKVDLDKLF